MFQATRDGRLFFLRGQHKCWSDSEMLQPLAHDAVRHETQLGVGPAQGCSRAQARVYDYNPVLPIIDHVGGRAGNGQFR